MFVANKNYKNDSLVPFLSEETLDYHYGKHHCGYANVLNKLVAGTGLENVPLRGIVLAKDDISKKMYNNAAQLFNHDFYWNSLRTCQQEPHGRVLKFIESFFGNVEKFYEQYIEAASGVFGSGWSWFVMKVASKELSFINTSNADCAINYEDIQPILTIDMWEHAYYIDYRNDRDLYLNTIVRNCLNWEFANSNIEMCLDVRS